ncbi:protein of unknown function [Legionella micdadei]|uniref:Uncharacterized protein n=1 Tax=Legionella micdadei TaxID=451 RepID=A0A098GHX6_LEGMI|nr:protein of unknown function [Legionella micdadei]
MSCLLPEFKRRNFIFECLSNKALLAAHKIIKKLSVLVVRIRVC